MHTKQGSRGVTLIELCFGVAVVAVLAGLAVPGMRTALRNAAMRSAVLELLTGLQQTRASSIAQARPGVLCLVDAAGNCLGQGGTAVAWASFLEGGAGRTPLAGRALPQGLELRATRAKLAFWPDSLASTTSTLTICDRSASAPPRALVISQNGRVRLTEGAVSVCQP